ncbi:MAG: adenylosuccinate lyase [Bacteroidales bacterium]|nr:adenylosuccinate lyase [Bacteroidales bacterium]MDD3527624.1 adenylosuccinate lyase [Bacteroidales bacterium]NCU36559.1 adenylosuccinate lyase [Candidatus Falkowbacteria bacterium]
MTHSKGLWEISPVDGRYQNKTETLRSYFSEAALMRYRLLVEVEYFISLCTWPLPQLSGFDVDNFETLREIYRSFDDAAAQRIKQIEAVTNHDVKAIEYYLREKFDELPLSAYKEFIHFGLTSQDINNTAVPLALKEAWQEQLWPQLENLQQQLYDLAFKWREITMLAHTHGQPASPTTLGKEIYVFSDRLEQQFALINTIPFSGKFGGATGNFNAHLVAFPDVDWVKFANKFTNEKLGIQRQNVTTQIEHYDNMAAFFDALKRINTILIDLARDMWSYISMEYFRQKIKEGEVGSSAMPHKVNPIDFENAEGNLGLANAMFEYLSAKLPISRLQRDLTDSTVSRNIGVPFAHTLIALQSLRKGLDKLVLNEQKITADLDENWAVVAEAIQTILRREGYPDPYNALKMLTRTGTKITRETMLLFIDTLEISDAVKVEMKKITPYNYYGISPF